MTPRTAAGQALYLSGVLQDDVAGARVLPAILAIEAEASAEPLRLLAALVAADSADVGPDNSEQMLLWAENQHRALDAARRYLNDQ